MYYLIANFGDDSISLIQWIIENKMKLNIVFVSHVGDIVQHHDIEDEFL